MSRTGRSLSPEEAALWARVVSTVDPIPGNRVIRAADEESPPAEGVRAGAQTPLRPPRSKPGSRLQPPPVSPAPRHSHSPSSGQAGLDSSWERKLARGVVGPDFTLDLHGATLDMAHGRLMHGLAQAKAMGARMVLLITGKSRPVDAADRGTRRGAIRAKVVDWLAASEHAMDIAAIRKAHRRHGGSGALYIILKRRKG